jgi:hypothetical protein
MKWLKRKIYSFLGLDEAFNNITQRFIIHRNDINELAMTIKERTEYHLDVHHKIKSQVILIGKFRNRDFIKCYSIDDRSFDSLIEHCKKINKYAFQGRIDSPPEFSAVIKNELRK